ncbi:hypothetical protein MBLNU457_3156t1 [Dothideomycetes sp. NU457]
MNWYGALEGAKVTVKVKIKGVAKIEVEAMIEVDAGIKTVVGVKVEVEVEVGVVHGIKIGVAQVVATAEDGFDGHI